MSKLLDHRSHKQCEQRDIESRNEQIETKSEEIIAEEQGRRSQW